MLSNNTQIPIVNERLKNILANHCHGQVQFIPVRLNCIDGPLENYHILNALCLFKGIDKEKSKCRMLANFEEIIGFDYLVYKSNCMNSFQIARDEEYTFNLLVDESLHEIFIKEKIKGAWLVKPENYFKPFNELL